MADNNPITVFNLRGVVPELKELFSILVGASRLKATPQNEFQSRSKSKCRQFF